MSLYDNITETLSSTPVWSDQQEQASPLPLSPQSRQIIHQQAILEPFTYLTSTPGKDVRTKLIQAFNLWLNVPTDRLGLISKVVNMLHSASLMYDDRTPLISIDI
jgi:geranylgeranyl diphosphate synthase type 3